MFSAPQCLQLPTWWFCCIWSIAVLTPIVGNRASTFPLNYIWSSDRLDLPTFTVVTEVGKEFFLYWRHHISQDATSEISHSSFYPLVYKCLGPITWGMTSWLFSSSRSQHATEFLMLPAIHGGPAEDSSLCSYFLLMHVSQCIWLFHCFFPIHDETDSFFSRFYFKFGTCPENSSTGKTVS